MEIKKLKLFLEGLGFFFLVFVFLLLGREIFIEKLDLLGEIGFVNDFGNKNFVFQNQNFSSTGTNNLDFSTQGPSKDSFNQKRADFSGKKEIPSDVSLKIKGTDYQFKKSFPAATKLIKQKPNDSLSTFSDSIISSEEIKEISIFSPLPDTEAKGVVRISGQAKGINEVELYFKQGEKPAYYLGETKVLNGRFSFSWDTSSTPNGEYYLLVKDKNSSFELAKPVKIIVNNPVKTSVKEISTNKEIEELKNVVNEIEELKEKVDSVSGGLFEGKKKEITERLEENSQKINQYIQEIIQEKKQEEVFVSQIEGKKQLKEAIKEQAVRPKISSENIPSVPEKISISQEEVLKKINDLALQHQKNKEKLVKELEQATKNIEAVSRVITHKPTITAAKKIAQKTKEVSKNLEKSKFQPFLPNNDLTIDTDGDGLSDFAEKIYRTDPHNPDTDGDGYLDGLEIKNGYDPLNSTPSVKIVYEEPVNTGEEKSDIYQVNFVENTVVKDPTTGTKKKGLLFQGRGLPNSFITLYIYSSFPIVVTTKVDSYGRWSYILTKPLPDGEHKIYAAITDNTGKIIAKSKGYRFFVLETKAVEKEEYERRTRTLEAETVTKSMFKGYFLATLGVSLLGLLIVLHLIKRRAKPRIIRKDYL